MHALKKCRWPVEKACKWYNTQPWTLGFNYIPGYAVNFTEMWQKNIFDPKVIDRELKWAADIGFNTFRTIMQFLVWKDDNHIYMTTEMKGTHLTDIADILLERVLKVIQN